jgi:1-acyl-sn-glycerol-3-phosphate acyltransferase
MTPPAQRSLANRAWQAFLKFTCRLTIVAVFNIRCHGRQYVPRAGGGLMLSNHQSNLDPVLIGLSSDRRLNYVARKTLFRFAPFRWLLISVDSIAIDREGLGLDGLKETLRRLKRGEMVLLFPEGTRTPDGEVHAIKPGFCAVARRAAGPIVPVAVDGAFDAWPRQRRFPRKAVIHVQFGPPLGAAEIAQLNDEELTAEVERRIRCCHARARHSRHLAAGLETPDGAADVCPR